jgi:hypothetical protein
MDTDLDLICDTAGAIITALQLNVLGMDFKRNA